MFWPTLNTKLEWCSHRGEHNLYISLHELTSSTGVLFNFALLLEHFNALDFMFNNSKCQLH